MPRLASCLQAEPSLVTPLPDVFGAAPALLSLLSSLEKLSSCCKGCCPHVKKRLIKSSSTWKWYSQSQAFFCLPQRTSTLVEVVIADVRVLILNLPVLLYDLGS